MTPFDLSRTALGSLLLLSACTGGSATPARSGPADSTAPVTTAASLLAETTAVAKPGSRTKPTSPTPPTAPTLRHEDSVATLVAESRIPGRSRLDSISLVAAIRKGLKRPWPVPGPEPLPGAILPARRIVAFYGNPLSTRMGILGEIAPDRMLARLDTIAAAWNSADPSTPVQPALHLITVVAQGKPGRDGKYRIRMDSSLIERVYGWSRARSAILFLDIQAGASTIEQELPRLTPWLSRPDAHLAIDPEFYMHYQSGGRRPGRVIGTLSAKEVNHAIQFLGDLVSRYQLPPKVLVIHRFTVDMLQDAEQIRLDPRVQVVINMDGWGPPYIKFDSYSLTAVAEPVQFTGFKLFFHNDTKKGHALLTPREVLALRPRPVYIQYQ
jgi:hypothetical protein